MEKFHQNWKNSLSRCSPNYLSTSPIITEVTPISALSNNNTPTYVFNTNEIGTVITSIDEGISSGNTISIVGDHSITFNTLSDGTYSDETITMTDASGNSSTLIM